MGAILVSSDGSQERDVAVQSLYERIGGEQAVMAAVDLFYEKVLADDRTRPFFEGLDMKKQIRKQVAFMTWALGGPEAYRGRDLRVAHAGLVRDRGLGDQHFDAIMELLQTTLREIGIADELVEEALGIIESERDNVLDR